MRLLPGVAALVVLVVGCIGGGSPHNVTIEVANESSTTGAFSWQSQGLFGTGLLRSTEREPFGGCAIYQRSVGPGQQTFTVTLGTQSLALTVDAAATDDLMRYVLIRPDGGISEVDQSLIPERPCDSETPTPD